MQKLHLVFYILLLEPVPNNAELIINVEIEEGIENEYKVEKILEMKCMSGKPHYLVRWKGYDTSENTWEPIKNLRGCP